MFTFDMIVPGAIVSFEERFLIINKVIGSEHKDTVAAMAAVDATCLHTPTARGLFA